MYFQIKFHLPSVYKTDYILFAQNICHTHPQCPEKRLRVARCSRQANTPEAGSVWGYWGTLSPGCHGD